MSINPRINITTINSIDTKTACFNRARYYDPSLERFLGEDLIGLRSGDTNFYRYVLNNPSNLTDPSGKNPLVIFIIIVAISEWGNTPDVGELPKTGLTPASNLLWCFGLPLYKTPEVLYHYTTREASELILKDGLTVGSNNLYGAGVYATRYNSATLARLQGASSTESKIIIDNTNLFKPTLFPGTFKTPGVNVPASCLCK